MSSSTHEILGSQYNSLNILYEENRGTVHSLQQTLIKDILPSLVDELQWDREKERFALQWLKDTPSIFRTLKRHEFTASFALEALQNTLWWRLSTLPPLASEFPSPHLICLPHGSNDPFGRPILIIKLAALCQGNKDLRPTFAHNMELLRKHLVRLNSSKVGESGAIPIMQYIALVDIGGMSLNTVQHIDLLSWFVHELIPRFPGMLGAVFVMNYSWAHAGLWNFAKRILPATALQKVFFPTQSELLEYFTPAVLPKELGGELPSEAELENPLQNYVLPKPADPKPSEGSTQASSPRKRLSSKRPQHNAMSSTSLFNPFFGYPVSYGDASAPSLRHGRRRKRDLLQTLARMWWARWKKHIGATLLVILAVVLVRKRKWFGMLRWKKVAVGARVIS